MPDLHSTSIGGSTAKRSINCPGWLNLSKTLPAQPSSAAADRGTLLHNAIADILDGKTNEDADVIGQTYKGIELTAELCLEKIVPALDELDRLQDVHGDFDMAMETRVSLEDVIPGSFGTADVIAKTDTCSVVLDWKFGDGVMVGAEHNEQGLYYAAAALNTPACSDLFEQDDDWPVHIIIVQPVASREQISDTWTTTVGYIKKFTQKLISVWPLVQEGKTFAAGDWCKFCPCNTPKCPVIGGHVEELKRADIAKLSPAELGRWLAEVPVLKDLIKNVEAMAFNALEAGQPVTGYKLVPKQARRYWVDETSVHAILRRAGKVGVCYDKKLKSPAQVEKALKGSKELIDKLNTFVDNKSSGVTIAQDSDPRASVLAGPSVYTDLAEKLKAKA